MTSNEPPAISPDPPPDPEPFHVAQPFRSVDERAQPPRSSGSISRRSLILLAVGGEGVLALVGLLWVWLSGRSLSLGRAGQGALIGITTALALAGVQYWMLRAAPDRGVIRGLRSLYRTALKPLFAGVSLIEILLISTCAGIGEEVLFRGAIQPAWGLVPASIAFGLCHVGGRSTWPLGLWAACVGGLLGGLTTATGGLLAPIVAHAVYDALALSYIRWGGDV